MSLAKQTKYGFVQCWMQAERTGANQSGGTHQHCLLIKEKKMQILKWQSWTQMSRIKPKDLVQRGNAVFRNNK